MISNVVLTHYASNTDGVKTENTSIHDIWQSIVSHIAIATLPSLNITILATYILSEGRNHLEGTPAFSPSGSKLRYTIAGNIAHVRTELVAQDGEHAIVKSI